MVYIMANLSCCSKILTNAFVNKMATLREEEEEEQKKPNCLTFVKVRP